MSCGPYNELTSCQTILDQCVWNVKVYLLQYLLSRVNGIHSTKYLLSNCLDSPLVRKDPELVLKTDSSKTGWGGVIDNNPLKTSGFWSYE
jgi:hypothetical protein